MSFKEEMLCELLNCGTCDLDMLESCNYNFEDILDKVDTFTTREEMKFDDILLGAIYIYQDNIQNKVEEMIKETENNIKYMNEELEVCGYGKRELLELEYEKQKLEDLESICVDSDIEYFVNYLDTNMYLNEEMKPIYKEYLSDIINEENEKIGFCQLDLED